MRERGVTLIECVIVLALLTLVAAVSLPRAGEAQRAMELRLTAELLVADLAKTRAWAVSHNAPVSFHVAESDRAYGFAFPGRSPERWTPLPEGITFIHHPLRPVTFFSRGNVVPAGSLVLRSSAGEVRVITAPMGRVRWEWSLNE
jgi:prepilin-type N-terminal cleavage/methylation domain-containing protein